MLKGLTQARRNTLVVPFGWIPRQARDDIRVCGILWQFTHGGHPGPATHRLDPGPVAGVTMARCGDAKGAHGIRAWFRLAGSRVKRGMTPEHVAYYGRSPTEVIPDQRSADPGSSRSTSEQRRAPSVRSTVMPDQRTGLTRRMRHVTFFLSDRRA